MSPPSLTEDREHLERARALARSGWGRVHPNPMVGCVLVRDGRVVAEGYHAEFGGPHAERIALERAGEEARGATAYVSLEPCAHRGKTPPCTEALVEAGVRRVVFGASDPGTESGGGADVLRSAGVEVTGPLLSPGEARRDNPAFFHNAREELPYVETKLAVSLDGGLAAVAGERTALTGPEALRRVHHLRAGFAGILVGSRTVEVDDPLLTVRKGEEPRRPPVRMVVDSRASTPPDAALFRDVDRVPVVIFSTEVADSERIFRLEEAGARIVFRPPGKGGVDLSSVLRWCRAEGIESVLCEGGGRLATSLLREGLCRRLTLHVAPRILGPGAVPAFPVRHATEGERLLEGWRIVRTEDNVGDDAILVLEPEV
ncbi:MAG: bifunctional diaminohydroxyphosphoribosylaminopyrimidine deaminase/5-amino-6-(5-phosphoribosylamino)uracil reductase RibD [Longimicrobiales bacterium]|nr:bifunctional diaminohydroxyphosphoribosylaminopyrimidine deaminase/5-amino-6-(5-phosphoribosylamino)uracil reductase RibD [Longimicrobiales bacterium]